MKRLLLIGIAILFVLAVAVMVVVFLITHERVETEVDLGPDMEARANPYLAIEEYLRRLDIDVDPHPDPHEPERLDDTDVVLMHPDMFVYDEFSTAVVDEWVPEGGHLLVLPPDDSEELHDEVIDAFDLQPHIEGVGDYHDGVPDWSEVQKLDDAIYTYDHIVGQPEIDYEEDVSFWDWEPGVMYPTIWGPPQPDFVATTDDGFPILTSSAHEDGRVTVLAEEQWITNHGLSHDGTAVVWTDVLSMSDQWPDEALLVLPGHQEDWMSRVWEKGWPFFAGLALLLLLGLTRGRRFGPPIPEPDRRRQRRGEHIRATGYFLWHHHGRRVLVDATRRALIEALTQRRPSLETMAPSERFEAMAEELQIKPRTVEHLLDGPIPSRQADFQTLIAQLEQLRRNL